MKFKTTITNMWNAPHECIETYELAIDRLESLIKQLKADSKSSSARIVDLDITYVSKASTPFEVTMKLVP